MYLGDFPTSAIVYVHFNTNGATGAPTSPSSAFTTSDIAIYRDDGTAQRTSAAGLTMSSSFDGTTGRHCLKIDTSDNTDAGFWAAGHDYTVELDTAKTVDSISVDGVILARFSIDNRGLLRPTVASRTLDVAANGGIDSDSWTNMLAATVDGIALSVHFKTYLSDIVGKQTVSDLGSTRLITGYAQDGSTAVYAITASEADGSRAASAVPS